jgi:hypothetical protein
MLLFQSLRGILDMDVEESPATKIGQIFTYSPEDVIMLVVEAIHLPECPKVCLTDLFDWLRPILLVGDAY